MATSTPLVPSRTALRVLRKLALGGSTIIGAVGGVCGVATVSYETHHRIRLAERLLETKRTVRSVSNSNGAAHIARMFEAAERGEDFGINISRPRAKQTSRQSSSLADCRARTRVSVPWNSFLDDERDRPPTKDDSSKAKPRTEAGESSRSPVTTTCKPSKLKPPDSALTQMFFSPSYTHPSTPLSVRSVQVQREAAMLKASNVTRVLPALLEAQASREPSPLGTPHLSAIDTLESSFRNSSTVERIMAATQQQHKLHSHTVFGRPGRGKGQPTRALNKNVGLWLNSGNNGNSRRHFSYSLRIHNPDTAAYATSPTRLRQEALEAYIESKPRIVSRSLQVPSTNHTRRSTSWGVTISSPHQGTAPKTLMSDGSLEGSYSAVNALDGSSLGNHFIRKHDTPTRKSPAEREMAQLATEETVINLRMAPYSPSHKEFRPREQNSQIVLDLEMEVSPLSNSETESPIKKLPIPKDSPNSYPVLYDIYHAIPEEEVVQKLGPDPSGWPDALPKAVSKMDRSSGRVLWKSVLIKFARAGDTPNWDAIAKVYEDFRDSFGALELHPAVGLLVRHRFRSPDSFNAAVGILFPNKQPRDEARNLEAHEPPHCDRNRTLNLYTNAIRYLRQISWQEADPDAIINELRNVIRAAKSRRLRLVANVFFHPIRAMCSAGEPGKAQAIFDEMIHYHGLGTDLSSWRSLLLSHGRNNDWRQVAKAFQAMHNDGISRSEPLLYSLLFTRVFREFCAQHTVIQIHDFVIQAVGYWGLVPTSIVCAAAIDVYLVNHRYDLVREWIETVRVLWPQVVLMSESFSVSLGSTWEKTNATCVEIEEACKAILSHKSDEPASPHFRTIVCQVLAQDLALKLSAVETTQTKAENVAFVDGPDVLDRYLAHAQAILEDSSEDNLKGTSLTAEAQEFLFQAQAVPRVLALVDGISHQKIPPNPSNWSRKPRSSAWTSNGHESNVTNWRESCPEALRHGHFPPRAQTEKLFLNCYAQRASSGLPINYTLLKHVASKLIRHDRTTEAADLLEVCHVKYSNAVPFDLALYEMWLTLAIEHKSYPQYRRAMAGVTGAPEELKITSKFLLLAKITLTKVLNQPTTPPNRRANAERLLKRLRERWEGQRRLGSKRRTEHAVEAEGSEGVEGGLAGNGKEGKLASSDEEEEEEPCVRP